MFDGDQFGDTRIYFCNSTVNHNLLGYGSRHDLCISRGGDCSSAFLFEDLLAELGDNPMFCNNVDSDRPLEKDQDECWFMLGVWSISSKVSVTDQSYIDSIAYWSFI
jgi:hypothetical protein